MYKNPRTRRNWPSPTSWRSPACHALAFSWISVNVHTVHTGLYRGNVQLQRRRHRRFLAPCSLDRPGSRCGKRQGSMMNLACGRKSGRGAGRAPMKTTRHRIDGRQVNVSNAEDSSSIIIILYIVLSRGQGARVSQPREGHDDCVCHAAQGTQKRVLGGGDDDIIAI